jgi:hypothetical protein
VAAEFQYEWDVRRLSGCKRSRFVCGNPKGAAALVAHAERVLTVASSGRRDRKCRLFVCLFVCRFAVLLSTGLSAVRAEPKPPVAHCRTGRPQVNFAEFLVAPLLHSISRLLPELSPCLHQLVSNVEVRCAASAARNTLFRALVPALPLPVAAEPLVISASTGARLCVAPNLRWRQSVNKIAAMEPTRCGPECGRTR